MKHKNQDMDASSAVAKFFGRLRDLPCWHCEQTFASWLSINFGQPHLRITEGDPNAKSLSRRKRSVLVDGDHRISITMCEWHIIRNGHELAWSSSPRRTIRKALCKISGQKLFKVEIDICRGKTNLLFETDINLRIKCQTDLGRGNDLWIFYSDGQTLALADKGHLWIGDDALESPFNIYGEYVSFDLTQGNSL